MMWVLLGLAVVVAVVVATGSALPVEHVASVSALVDEPLDAVWARVNSPAKYPEWRRGLTRVETGQGTWVEFAGRKSMPYVIDAAEPPSRLVSRIADPTLPFGGTWTWQLEARGPQTWVTLTEHGFVKPAVFRFLSRFVFGHETTMKHVLADLRAAGGGAKAR